MQMGRATGKHSAAINLYEFFNYFGNYFKQQDLFLNGETVEEMKHNFGNENTICVYDPLNLDNNTTRSTFRYDEIKKEFKKARRRLYQFCKEISDR